VEFFKTILGRVVTGLIVLTVIAAGISWYEMDPQTRQALLNGTGHIVSWFGVVLVWPWASFALITRVAKMDSNLAGAILVAVYTIAETILLAWLFSWHIAGGTGWTFFILGGLVSAVYNLLVCDWIAEKMS
jgi:hypothetical protein